MSAQGRCQARVDGDDSCGRRPPQPRGRPTRRFKLKGSSKRGGGGLCRRHPEDLLHSTPQAELPPCLISCKQTQPSVAGDGRGEESRCDVATAARKAISSASGGEGEGRRRPLLKGGSLPHSASLSALSSLYAQDNLSSEPMDIKPGSCSGLHRLFSRFSSKRSRSESRGAGGRRAQSCGRFREEALPPDEGGRSSSTPRLPRWLRSSSSHQDGHQGQCLACFTASFTF